MLRERSDGRLSQTDAAIVRRDCRIDPDSMTPALHKEANILKQQSVLKHAAGEHNCVETLLLTERDRGVAHASRHAEMKSAGDLGLRRAFQTLAADALKQRAIIQFTGNGGKWEGIAPRFAACELLEPNRSLTFECHFANETEQ